MAGPACTLNYGQTAIGYELHRSARKTLEVAVHPDKRVVVKAPESASLAAIEAMLMKRAGWITRQLAYYEQFDPRTPARRYVGGESHLYLGRKYRLKLHPAGQDRVSLQHGYFHIECASSEPAHIKRLLDAWYEARAQAVMAGVLDECWRRFPVGRHRRPALKLRDMKTRWGSLSSSGRLTLNSRLIQTPKECIEYVVIHELCHLAHHNHGPGFYALLERALPDWAERKQKLEAALA